MVCRLESEDTHGIEARWSLSDWMAQVHLRGIVNPNTCALQASISCAAIMILGTEPRA